MRPSHPKCWSQILLVFIASPALGSPLFESYEPLDVEVRGPIEDTIKDKRGRGEQPFAIIVDGEAWPVQVRVRGKSRVGKCRFPPLRLNFSGDEVEDGPFAGLDKVKLVTHCQGPQRYEANLFEEYAVYRMFSLLSDFSHRVRLMRIRYVDTSKPGKDPVVRHAFAIEPIEQVAARMAAEVRKAPHVVKSRLAKKQAALVFVYHYLVANTDWSLVTAEDEQHCCHNGNLVRKDGRDHLVPYDFDLSGFVNPSYAAPDPSLRINRVTRRLYRGYCIEGLDLTAAVDAIVAKEVELLAMVKALPDADEKEARKRLPFLEKFFESARSGSLAEDFESDCVG